MTLTEYRFLGKPKRCQKQRFSILLKGTDWTPECTKSGQFAVKQCNKGKEQDDDKEHPSHLLSKVI